MPTPARESERSQSPLRTRALRRGAPRACNMNEPPVDEGRRAMADAAPQLTKAFIHEKNYDGASAQRGGRRQKEATDWSCMRARSE